jgi:prophage maintenance system killer protein
MKMTEKPVQLFSSTDGQIELTVSLDTDTVWLSQRQMADLFDKDVRTINEHIKNIYAEQELSQDPTIRKSRIVQQEGKRQVNRDVDHYNLDVIISVGYRVKSHRGVQFRQWATRMLKQHLVEGYTLNQQRLKERGIEFTQALDLLSQTLSNQALISAQGQQVLSVISDYARSWSLLQGYDEQNLKEQSSKQSNMQALAVADALNAMMQLKQELINKGEATALFGQLRGNGLESAINTIEQGFGGEWFYPNIASRAANLLYLVIKNHPLADGNKRTGSFLFLWYLRVNQHLLSKPVEQLINDNTLVALALLIAESKPDQKQLMIRLVEHFILLKETSA